MINPRINDSTHLGSGFGSFVHASSDDLWIAKGDKRYIRDHGIGEHLAWIHDRYPNTPIIPLILTYHNPQQTIDLITNYLDKHPNTRVIGSIDYSHYVPDKRATLHDSTTIFASYDPDASWNSIRLTEVDCPSCLATITSLARQHDRQPKLRFRDFSDDGRNSTSRQFWSFDDQKTKSQAKRDNEGKDDTLWSNVGSSGFTLARVGDTMRTRGVAQRLSTQSKRNNFFRDFFQQRNPSNNLRGYRHRLLNGIDIVGMNMETGLVGSGQSCNPGSGNDIRLCSDHSRLSWRKELGFDVVSVANNHALIDSNHTIDWLNHHRMDYLGSAVSNDLVPLRQTIRGINVAMRGLDQTVINHNLTTVCQKIATDPSVHIVSIHRGLEYQGVTALQRHTAHKLIDCGVDVIIGHHPHIVQDIEWYQGKPIAYSLGNFLFDQDRPGTTTGAIFHLIWTPKQTRAWYADQ